MNPTRRRRLWLVLAIVAAAVIATTLVALALQRNVTYLYTPSEVYSGEAGTQVASGQARFRLGGMVAGGSFARDAGSLEARFEVDDGDARMPVAYTGILPTCSARTRPWSRRAGCATACSSPRKCWRSTTRTTCRAKSPTRWARPMPGTMSRPHDPTPRPRKAASVGPRRA